MHFWEHEPQFADLEALARKLESALHATNDALIKLAQLDPQLLVESFAQTQGKILGFDNHGMRRFLEALEEKRVKTLAMGNLFMCCVLTAAVGLSEFKKQPHLAGGASFFRRRLDKLRTHSTNSLALAALASASFSAVIGQGAWYKFQLHRKINPPSQH